MGELWVNRSCRGPDGAGPTFFCRRTTLVHFFSSSPSYFLTVLVSSTSSGRLSSSRNVAAVPGRLFAERYAIIDLCLPAHVSQRTRRSVAKEPDLQLFSLAIGQNLAHCFLCSRARCPLARRSKPLRMVKDQSRGGRGRSRPLWIGPPPCPQLLAGCAAVRWECDGADRVLPRGRGMRPRCSCVGGQGKRGANWEVAGNGGSVDARGCGRDKVSRNAAIKSTVWSLVDGCL